jgi:hypothetical protein
MGLKITLGLSKWARIAIAIVNKKRSSAEMIDCLTAMYIAGGPKAVRGGGRTLPMTIFPLKKKKKTRPW